MKSDRNHYDLEIIYKQDFVCGVEFITYITAYIMS